MGINKMKIGQSFGDELAAAGLSDAVATWGDDGSITYQPDATQQQIAGIEAVLAKHDPNAARSVDLRAKRDALLTACDWTQCRDVPDAVAASWQPYRKALRDLTKQAGFPDSITWPIAP